MRATAAVFEKLFTPLSVTEAEIDSPGPGEVLVKIVAANALVPVAADADIALLGPLACGISTGAGAVLNALRPFAGSSRRDLRRGRGRAFGGDGGPRVIGTLGAGAGRRR